MPKVSVIIPTYNSRSTLRKTIESILQQTESNFEIVVVDDESTDDTKEVVKSINDSRICYFYQTNKGPAGARNKGLKEARGAYIAFLDHDDLWPENYLEVMVNHLENNPEYGVVYSPITIAYSNGKIIKSYKRPAGKSGWLTIDLFKRGFVWPSAAIIRKAYLKDVFFDESLNQSYEDGDFFLRLSTQCMFLFMDNVEAIRTEHTNNFSAKVGVLPTRILVLERFYYKLGGKNIIPTNIARRRLSHACRKVAKNHRLNNNRAASVFLYKKAIKYWPFDIRLFLEFLKSIFISKSKDMNPNWRMPEILMDI